MTDFESLLYQIVLYFMYISLFILVAMI